MYLDKSGGCGIFEVNSAPGFDQIEDFERTRDVTAYKDHYGAVVDLLNYAEIDVDF